ncbi:proline/glycine betaine transporter [Legionella donaldsonii]|uniref:Proline/glycine betaine transporter n=1 Tax=Legionella donaldsonii TaxID=45060 RepID=A0A378JK41_9GAMM|nr:MFS transporter [Legionella donaldsonii]STX45060.1 proline/glycine betaine transporter [Legionella donaldsonii]
MKRKALILVLALVFLEWLDFSLYLYLAKSVFAVKFFPPSAYSLELTFALFAAAYFARPVGGWLFGCKADLSGRRNPMVFSAALMGLATLGIALLPDYAQIGLWATWGLLLLRMAQGLALGGEINTSAMFLVEHHPHRVLLAGALVAAGGAFGMFIGSALATLLQYISLPEVWRIIFALVGFVSLWVCHLRKQLQESPEFRKNQLPMAGIWRRYGRGFVNIAAIAFFVSITVYICNVFWVSFAIDRQLWSEKTCLWTGSLAQLASALLAIPIAYFARPTQVYHLMRAGMLLAIITAPALFYFTLQANTVGVLIAITGYALTNALICASLYYLLYLQLPAQYRCRGVSTIWAIAAGLGAVGLPIAEQAIIMKVFWLPGLLVAMTVTVCFILLSNYQYQFGYSTNDKMTEGL